MEPRLLTQILRVPLSCTS